MISELNFKYGIPEAVTFLEGEGGSLKALLRHRKGFECEVYLQGATVTAWRMAPFGELLYLSRKADFRPDKAIRGGIPLIFPQFGGGPLPTHGFARNQPWEVCESHVNDDGAVRLTLRLTDNAASRSHWPYGFELLYSVALTESLGTELIVRNTGGDSFSFQSALHTYFRVKDIAKVSVKGMQGLTYVDKVHEGKIEKQGAELLKIDREVDRVFQRAPALLELKDEGARRLFVIDRENMPDAVVWNPWKEKTSRMSDMDALDYNVMICVESAVAASPPVLAPGQSFTSLQKITVKSI